MAITKIRGNTQIIDDTIANAQINSAAAIATTKLADGANFLQRGGSVALTANLPAGGFTISGLGTPSSSTDAATKGYVDNIATGLDVKGSVRAATTGNITLSNTQTIDGVALSASDRVLVKDQSTASQNGIYIVVSGGAWTRATDADTNSEVTPGMFVFVEEGTVNADSGWILTTDGTVTLGTTNLTFTQFSGAGQVIAGGGLTKTGNTLDVVGTTNRIVVNADSIDIGTDVVTLTGTQTLTNKSIVATQLTGTLASGQFPALTGDITTSAGSLTTALANIPSGTPMAGSLLATAIAAPGTPASGKGSIYIDSTTKNIAVKDDAGVIKHGVQTKTATSNQFLTAISAAGVVSSAQPAFSDISGSVTAGQLPQFTGGDVTTSGAGSVNLAIGSNKVTLAMLATLAANSVIGNSTGSTATPTAISLLSTPTASSIALRDGNANLRTNNFIGNIATTATAAGSTVLTITSAHTQQFTGTTTQTVVLPNATTLSNGHSFLITNRSSGVVTVNANGGGLVQTMAAGSQTLVTLIDNGSAAGSWDSSYALGGAGAGTVTSVSVVSANGFAGSVATATSTPAITLSTSITGLLKGNGTAISAATLGTDYTNNASFVVRETPSGSVNGSNTTFTLANTPTTGTEQVFLNGILQEPGAGNDYTISGTTITYLAAPVTGDKIRVTYMK